MFVSTVAVAFKLLELYRRANKTCQETCQGKLLVCAGLQCILFLIFENIVIEHQLSWITETIYHVKIPS